MINRYFIVLPTTSPYGYSSSQEEENLRYFRVTILSPLNYHLSEIKHQIQPQSLIPLLDTDYSRLAPVGVSTTFPPKVRGFRLSALKAASSVVRSLVRFRASGLPPVKQMMAFSFCCSPAMPSRRTVAAYFPALAPEVIFANCNSTFVGVA